VQWAASAIIQRMRRRVLLLGVLLAALATAALLLPVREWLAAVLAWTQSHRELAWLTYVLLYVLACVFLLPGLILTVAAGVLFGLPAGIALASLGSVLGATAAFLVGRTLAREWVSARIKGWPRFRALDKALGARGFWIVLLTRLSPLFPFNLLNYAYGITAVRPREYVVGSWIGMLPATALYVYAGSAAASLGDALSGDVQTGRTGQALLWVGLAATLAVTVLVTRLATRALDRELTA
jgi:uncharacterized membrane protein YdjX (TVP38/TMEM64 family)